MSGTYVGKLTLLFQPGLWKLRIVLCTFILMSQYCNVQYVYRVLYCIAVVNIVIYRYIVASLIRIRYSSQLSLHSRVPFTRVFINFIRVIGRRSRVTARE